VPFCRYKALKSPTLFSMTLRTRLPDAFHHLAQTINYQTHFKNAKFDLGDSEKCQLANLVANRDWLIVTSYRLWHAFSSNAKQLQRHDSVHLSSVYTDYSFSS